MMIVKTNEQVEMMRQSALLVSKTLTEVAAILKPGITTLSIDNLITSNKRLIMTNNHI